MCWVFGSGGASDDDPLLHQAVPNVPPEMKTPRRIGSGEAQQLLVSRHALLRGDVSRRFQDGAGAINIHFPVLTVATSPAVARLLSPGAEVMQDKGIQ